MNKRDAAAVATGVAAGAGAAIGYQAWKRSTERDMVDGRPAELRRLDPASIKADPETFQFKAGGDNKGVTDRLKSVESWNPVAAGKAMVFEKIDGTQVIADGHQRLGLAQRLIGKGQDGIKIDAYVMRERDGWTPRDVRAYAAIKNMHESSGQPLDMAKVMRERPDLLGKTKSLPMSDSKVADAMSLSKLSDAAFKLVVGGVVKPEYAAAVGSAVSDSTRHEGMLKEMVKAEIASAQHARLYVGQAMAAPTITESNLSLFGEETNTRSLLAERAKVLDKALSALKSDKRIFGLLEREAGNIESVGNKLSHSANVEKAEGAGRTASLIEKLATTRGPVSDMIDYAARQVAAGEKPTKAAREFVKHVGDSLKKGGINALTGDSALVGERGWQPEAREASAKSRAGRAKAEPRVQEMLGGRKWQSIISKEDIAAAREKIKGTSPEAMEKWGKILDDLPAGHKQVAKRRDGMEKAAGKANPIRVQRMEDGPKKPLSNYDMSVKAEAKKVVRNFNKFTSEQRADMASSHRLGPQQRNAVGNFYYTHPAIPNRAFDTRGAAAKAGLAALDNPPQTAKQVGMFGEATMADKIAAQTRALEAKGRTGDPMNEGLFGSSSKQTDLVEMAKQAPKPPGTSLAVPGGQGLSVKVGSKSFPVESWEQVSKAYRATVDTMGIGASQAHRAQIVDQSGKVVAHVSYNGKVWAGETWKSGDKPLFDPYDAKGPAGWSDAAREASADARKADPHAAERERIANGTKRIGDTYKAPAPAAPTAADKFTSGMKPMAAAKAKAALETQVRHNRNEFLTRAALVERQIANGASVQTMKIGGKEQRVLMGKDGAFLDSRAITKAGLDYAEHLSAMKPSNPNYTPGVGTKQESYWGAKAGPTPTVNELPEGAFKGTQRDFESLSPGMRREIARSAANAAEAQPGIKDADGNTWRKQSGSDAWSVEKPAASGGTLKMMGIPADGSKPFVMAIMDSPGSLAEQQAKAAKNFEQNAKHYTQKLSGYELHDSSGKVVGWSDEARAASAEVRGEKAMAKNPVSEAERAGRINRLRNRAGAGGIEGAAADRFVSENLAKLEALDAKRAAMNKATADVPTIAPAEKFKGTPIPAKAETAIKAYDDAKGSGLRGTQNEANREAIIKNRKANAAPPDSPAGQAARYAKKAGMKAPVFRSAVNDHLAAKGLPALPKNAALDKVGAHLEKHLGGTGAHGLMGDLVQGKFAPPAAKPRSNVDLVRNLQATAMGAKRQVFPDAATGQKTGQPVAEKPATTANPAGQKTGAGKKALGLLAPVAIGAGALIAMNQSAKAGESKVDQLKTGSIEAVKGTGVLAGFAAGTAVVAKGFMKLGMTAAKAAPATQAVLMAGGAIHGAATAKPGERMKGAAKGAWDMSLPGMVVNTGIAVKEAVKSTADRTPVNGRLSDQQAKAYASASARFATMRGAAQETDGTAKAKGWSNAARIGAYQARAAKNGFDPTNMPYGGKPENGPDKWQGKKG